MREPTSLEAIGDRIDSLVTQLQSQATPPVRDMAEEAIALVLELHAAGLARVLELLGGVDGDPRVIRLLLEDDLVSNLLILHDLHPSDLAARVQDALDGVRPYLGSHGGDVELIGVDPEAASVTLRMLGSCDGCPSSSVTLKLAVETAILKAAPEIETIEVEGHEDPTPQGATTPVALGRKSAPEAQPAWASVDLAPDLDSGAVVSVELKDGPVLFCRLGESLYAYLDSCPTCSARLGQERVDGEVIRCVSCRTSYDVRLAGRNLDGGRLHLTPVPLLGELGGDVRVAIPVGA